MFLIIRRGWLREVYDEGEAHVFDEKLDPLFNFLLKNYSTVKKEGC